MGQRWVFDSTIGSSTLDEIDDMLARMWSAHLHVPQRVRIQVGIAAGEIGANIVEHASVDRAVWMRMEARVGLTAVKVDFTDDGGPTLVNLDKVSLPDEMAEGGRGLALARAALDSLHYRRNGLNHWTLVSKRFA